MKENVKNLEEISELDLRNLISLLIRQKNILIISFFSVFTFIYFYYTNQKKIWQGEFQIVLSNNQEAKVSPISKLNGEISSVLGSSFLGSDKKLQTELKIIESPSVLKPVYDFVKEYKTEKGVWSASTNFTRWKNGSLNYKLLKDTSILELTYKDSDKNLIIPVLNLISKEYQAYSGRDRSKGLNNTLNYLKEQISVYKKKSLDSFNKASIFAEENNLDPIVRGKDNTSQNIYTASLSIENQITETINEINILKSQLETIQNIDDYPKSLEYISTILEDSEISIMWGYLDKVNNNLIKLRAIFYENDPIIQTAKREKQLLMEDIKIETINSLKGRISFLETLLKSIKRPSGVFLKYRELINEATQDNLTYLNLKSNYEFVALQKAKSNQPWELISNPTVLDYPIGPGNLRISAIGMSAGAIIGVMLAFIVEIKIGLLYGLDVFKKLIPYKYITKFSKSYKFNKEKNFEILLNSEILKESKSLVLVPVVKSIIEENKNFIKEFEDFFNSKGKKLIFSEDILEIKKYQDKIVLVESGKIKREDLSTFFENISLLSGEIIGWIFLDD